MVRTTIIPAALLLSILMFLPGPAPAGKMYRWVDEEGRVHYSDKVPVEHSRNERFELNERGIAIERTEAAKTPEEIAREEELARLRAEQQRLIEAQRAKDRVLLRTFRSEDDMLMARNGKLAAIDAIIQIIRSNIRRMKEKLAEIQRNAASIERQGRDISKNLLKDIENTRQQLKQSYAAIIRKEEEKEIIRAQFAEDIRRFRNLKKLQLSREKDPLLERREHSLLDTVVICKSGEECDRAWLKVEDYVRKHATTRLQMLSESIVMTAAAAKDRDISITVSRIQKPEEETAKLFMDLQCKNSPRGRDFCETEDVEKIRTGFHPFITENL